MCFWVKSFCCFLINWHGIKFVSERRQSCLQQLMVCIFRGFEISNSIPPSMDWLRWLFVVAPCCALWLLECNQCWRWETFYMCKHGLRKAATLVIHSTNRSYTLRAKCDRTMMKLCDKFNYSLFTKWQIGLMANTFAAFQSSPQPQSCFGLS